MNTYYKYMAVALAGFLAVGCADLDTEPLGSTVTSQQKEEVLRIDPAKINAAVNALPQGLKLAGALYSSHHGDYGVPSIFMITDSRGMDMPAPNIGYNWYSAAAEMSDFGGNYYDNLIFWGTFYNEILAANSVIASVGSEPESAELKFSAAQAFTFRAYCYYHLAQMYQFTYAKDPDAPCVPIYTAENMTEAGKNGNPRATVGEVYEQALNDLTTAIALLEAAEQEGQKRSDKRFVDSTTAYGLRARVNLFATRWAEAAADAEKALSLATAAGLHPISIEEASVPGFTELSAPNFIWGIQCLPTESFTQGVRNFASMMGSWMSNGYCSAGVYRSINKKLYNQIPKSDVRRGWWLDDMAYPETLPQAYVDYINSTGGGSDISEFLPYTQIKFGAADNNPGSTSGATDIPLLRVEELYLTLAEAQGRISPSQGASTLADFVKAYRNPSYSLTATSVSDLVDAVWFQRRIELWGEGMSYYDMMRLQKPMNRLGGGFDKEWCYVVAPENPVLIFVIVTTEQQANPLIDPSDCDNGASVPKPVADEE